ncbi:MAG: GNAT family N-acetyltransferase [Novosphingobium sp.]
MTDLWLLERIFRDAWPALEELESDGWLARLTGGDTRRPNAINPLGPNAGDVREAIEAFRGAYAAAGLRQIVRVPDFCPDADAALESLGLKIEGTTRTIAAALVDRDMPDHAGVTLEPHPSADWIAARVGPGGDPATEALLARLEVPALFATVQVGGVVGAIGYAAIDEGFAVIESIRTMPDFKRRGLGSVCVGALMAGAAGAGAHTAALQVDAANTAGLALYSGLGFDHHLYDYHYRVPG